MTKSGYDHVAATLTCIACIIATAAMAVSLPEKRPGLIIGAVMIMAAFAVYPIRSIARVGLRVITICIVAIVFWIFAEIIWPPRIAFTFANTAEYIEPPGKNHPNTWTVHVKLITSHPLTNAIVESINVVDLNDESDLPRNWIWPLAWNAGPRSFQPATVIYDGIFLPLVSEDVEGKTLRLFVPADEEELTSRERLDPGHYRITIRLIATELPGPITRNLCVNWTGDMRGFQMDICR